jgi:SAM-dependent methyltransferase
VFTPTHTSLALAEVIEVLPGEVVADVGCGCGALALVAARLGAAKVLGTDIVPAAVRLAGLNARRLGLEDRAEFHTGHLLDPLPDASVDVVIGDVSGIPDPLAAVTGWLPGGGPSGAELPVAMLEGARRVLRPGGRMYLPTASIQFEERVLAAASRLFEGLDLLDSRQFPLPAPVARSAALAELIDQGVVRVEQRGTRLLWRLRLWCGRRPVR